MSGHSQANSIGTVGSTFFIERVDDEGTDTVPNGLAGWWIALGGLFALLLSCPVTLWALDEFDGLPMLLSLWAFVVPTFAIGIAIGWFLIRAPTPSFDVASLFTAVVLGPLLMAVGILGNAFTCGFGLPIVAIYVISQANAARRRQSHRQQLLKY